MDDACESLLISLFHLAQLLQGPLEFQEARLAFNIEINLLSYIHEIIEMTVSQESPHLINLSANHWLLALKNANIIYQNVGSQALIIAFM